MQTGFPVTGFMRNYPNSALGVGDPANVAKVPGDGGITGAELSLFNSGTGGRVPQFLRNAFTAPTLQNVDARLARTFSLTEKVKVDLFVEAFNLTNSQIPLSVVTSASSYAAALLPGQKGYVSACDASAHTNACIYPYVPSNSTQPFGAVSSTTGVLDGPRQMQFTARVSV